MATKKVKLNHKAVEKLKLSHYGSSATQTQITVLCPIPRSWAGRTHYTIDLYICPCITLLASEPVWPSGKALGWYWSRRTSVRHRFGSPFSSERLWFVNTVLWLCPSRPTETLKWLSSLPILMQESFWWWQCSDRYVIFLFPYLHTPFPPPFSPSLISLMVSVDVKHRVYLLTSTARWLVTGPSLKGQVDRLTLALERGKGECKTRGRVLCWPWFGAVHRPTQRCRPPFGHWPTASTTCRASPRSHWNSLRASRAGDLRSHLI